MLKIKSLVKSFSNGEGEFVVLKNLNFEIPAGQFLSVIGRSGSGKSTLLYQMSLLDYPTSGSILIDNFEISSLHHDERTNYRLMNFGYVFQDYALIPTLTAIENVAIPLLMQGLSRTEAYKKASDALEAVGLSDKLDNPPSKLSGGQQQRVSIARAIAHNPRIIFADEPTANLDNESSEIVLEVFKKLNANGQTIVMVTHEEEYAQMTHRTITLSDGVITKDVLHPGR